MIKWLYLFLVLAATPAYSMFLSRVSATVALARQFGSCSVQTPSIKSEVDTIVQDSEMTKRLHRLADELRLFPTAALFFEGSPYKVMTEQERAALHKAFSRGLRLEHIQQLLDTSDPLFYYAGKLRTLVRR